MEGIVAADLLVGGDPVPLVRLEQVLLALGYDEVDDHGGAAGHGGLGALVKVVDARGAHELELEVGVGIDAAGHHVFATGVDRPRAARYDEVPAQLSDGRRAETLRVLVCG